MNLLADARMRADGAWTDVRIRNASARGLMIEAPDVPERGDYIEIRRGSLVVIGRVAWSRDGQFGLRSQDRIDIEALMHPPDLSRPEVTPDLRNERRKDATRIGTALKTEERSRQIASWLQYAAFAAAAAFAALIAAMIVGDVLSRPLQAISNALGR